MHYFPIMAVTARNPKDAYSQAQGNLNRMWESSRSAVYDFGDVIKSAYPVDGSKAIKCIRNHIQIELNTIQEYWNQLRGLRERMANSAPPALDEKFYVKCRAAHEIGCGRAVLIKSGTEIERTTTFDQLLWIAERMLALSEHIQDKHRSERFVCNAYFYDRREDTTQDIMTVTAKSKVWLVKMDLHS